VQEGDFYTAAEAARILRISKRRVLQMLGDEELEGEQDASGRWRVPMRAVHAKLEARRGERLSRLDREILSEAPESPSEAREWIERAQTLERQLGRLEGRLELSERTESTLREQLDRERERADRQASRIEALEEELREERGKGFWRRLFGG
jgi:chromosome segregation ATPase